MRIRRASRGRCLIFLVLGTSWAALAEAQVSANVGVDSDYRFRGVSLSDDRPSLRTTLNYDAANACYGGAAATRVELARGDRYAQLQGYAGCVVPGDDARQFDLGATYSHFTGDSTYDFAEAYAGVLADRWSARLSFAPDYFGRHVPTAYAELDTHRILDEQFRLIGHVGLIAALRGDGGASASRFRADLRLGVGWVLRGLDVQLAWVAASRGGPYPAVYGNRRAAWVAAASYSF